MDHAFPLYARASGATSFQLEAPPSAYVCVCTRLCVCADQRPVCVGAQRRDSVSPDRCCTRAADKDARVRYIRSFSRMCAMVPDMMEVRLREMRSSGRK